MSHYRGPRLRICRRLGELPGLTSKVSKKTNPPGDHGAVFDTKPSQFSIRLKEKQKLRFNYGVTERQLLNYVKKARKKKGSSGFLLLNFLEMRLDNILFRTGFAPTIFAAKQLISHGHVLVNDYLVDIPSFICQPMDKLRIKRSSRSQKLVRSIIERIDNTNIPSHLALDKDRLEVKVLSVVNRKSLSLMIDELLVIEYYSRKL